MQSDRLNRWLTLGANVGVLIGIILLIAELNQNRELMRAQTRNELARGLTDVLNPTVHSPEFADLLVRANAGERLTPSEAARIAMRSELTYRYWENVHYQYRQGLYDDSEFSRHADTMAYVISNNLSLQTYWCEQRMLYSVPFMEFIDELDARLQCE